MSANQKVARLIKRVIWFLPARRFRKNTVRALAHIEDILPTIETQWQQANQLGLTKYSTLYNSMSFLLLLHYDLAVLAYDHATEVDERKQNLYARQLCLLLHEALEDIPSVFGGKFRKAAASLPNGDNYLLALSGVLKTLSDIRKENHAQIAEIRNFVAAHRDHDALNQLEIMRKIDSLWLMAISGKFIEFLGKMAGAVTPLLSEMGNPPVIFKHIADRT
jgi:hypothetical protein